MYINHLRNKLSGKLPGKRSHDKMTPSPRGLNPSMSTRTKAGVLVLLYPRDNALNIPLILRADHPGPHGGQVSLPGGKIEKGDKNLQETALRETMEEIGIPSRDVEVLGKLTTLDIPISGFTVEPWVGAIDYSPNFVADPEEVQEVIEVQLTHLLRNSSVQQFVFKRKGTSLEAPCFQVPKSPPVWGATAMILREFADVLST